MASKPIRRNTPQSAFTLVEMMVVSGISLVVLAAVTSVFLFSLTSFGSMANYADFNRRGRAMSDNLSLDIRCAGSVVSCVSSQIVLSASDGVNISYAYDAANRTVTRQRAGESRTMLKDVAWVAFALYQQPTTNDAYNVFSPSDAANAKMVGFQWSCSKLLVGTRFENDDIQTAIVSMRNR